MNTLARLLLTILLAVGAGCAQKDWIDRTLVTVDVTGTWAGTMMAVGSAMGARDVVLELEQRGATVKGTMRVTPSGSAPDTLEGTVAGDVFRFKGPRANWEGELTVSEEEMAGSVRTGIIGGVITLRRVDPSSRPASPPR